MFRLVALLALTSSVAFGQVPAKIGYQGFLRALDGGPVDQLKELTFSLYDSPEGGAPRWTETQRVLFSQGHYAVFLGDASGCEAGPCRGLPPELFRQGGELFLELTVDGAPFRPRQRLSSSPFALMSQTAYDVRGGVAEVGSVDAGNVRTDTLTCGAVQAGSVSASSVQTGSLSVGGVQSFGSRPGQHINLFGAGYGLGVQASTTYLRTGGGLAVHRGGTHNDAAVNPGGGTVLMSVDQAGALTTAGGVTANGAASATSYAVQGTTVIDNARNFIGRRQLVYDCSPPRTSHSSCTLESTCTGQLTTRATCTYAVGTACTVTTQNCVRTGYILDF